MAYFADHPNEAGLFNEAMADKAASVIPAVLNTDFSRFSTIADIGGGRGHLLEAILKRVQPASGILFELPHVIAHAERVASPRLQLVAGNFFKDPLPVADAYVLMEVLHAWSDTDAATILAAIRRAAPKHARLVVVETLVSDSPGPHFGKALDVLMLGVTGGRERTASEYTKLLADAGFRLERIMPTPTAYSVVDAVVVQ